MVIPACSVRWRAIEGDDKYRELVSEIELNVDMEVPKWFHRVVPLRVVRYTGSKLLQGILNGMVPSFLGQLEQDYAAWSNGDTSRKPLGDGSLSSSQS